MKAAARLCSTPLRRIIGAAGRWARQSEPWFGRCVQRGAVPKVWTLLSPALFACNPKGDRTAIFTHNQISDENRGEADRCNVLRR